MKIIHGRKHKSTDETKSSMPQKKVSSNLTEAVVSLSQVSLLQSSLFLHLLCFPVNKQKHSIRSNRSHIIFTALKSLDIFYKPLVETEGLSFLRHHSLPAFEWCLSVSAGH